jgi:NAD(P)H dehydrogenase (quinone)
MTKVLVLYYSAYGHIQAMANAVAEGAREAGASVDIRRVPELVPAEVAKASHYKLDQSAPVSTIEELANYHAVIVGTGTRFGRMSSQMANFLDKAGGLWAKGALHGKVGGAFTSSATQHGGQETTLFSIITNLLHFGMIIVGLDYGFAGQTELNDVTGGSPLRQQHDHRRRWQTPAERKRAGRRALSRPRDRGDGEKTAWLIRVGRHPFLPMPFPLVRTDNDGFRHARDCFYVSIGLEATARDHALLVVQKPVPRLARTTPLR